MKKMYLSLALGLSIISCSPTSDENSEDKPQQEQDLLRISKLSGGDNAQFLYEDGKIIKGVGDSSNGHTTYDDAFEVVYGENGLVKQIIKAEKGAFIQKPTDFSFDLTSGDYYTEIYNYQYEGNQLESITNQNGEVVMEFSYNSKGFITQIFRIDGYDHEITKYYYNSDGDLERYTFTVVGESYDAGGEIKTDTEVNPLYYHWKNFKLIIPGDISGITTYNVIGYPHNVLEIYDGAELDFKAQIEYDESDHPVYYREMLSDRDAVYFEYLD